MLAYQTSLPIPGCRQHVLLMSPHRNKLKINLMDHKKVFRKIIMINRVFTMLSIILTAQPKWGGSTLYREDITLTDTCSSVRLTLKLKYHVKRRKMIYYRIPEK